MFFIVRSYLLILVAVLILSGCSKMNQDGINYNGSGVVEHHEEDPNEKSSELKSSPRHQERVQINNSGKIIYTWIVYPEVQEKATVVLVIHENKGLNDWARQMADDIAAQGYIAVAPDLLSSFSNEKKRTSDFTSEDEATKALYTISSGAVVSDLNAVYAYANKLSAANGKVVSAGFCRGGSQSFLYATANPELDRSFVFYGTAPENTGLFASIVSPVIAYYGGDDARVNATISGTQQAMKDLGKEFDFRIYSGAGHAFMRSAVMPDAKQANVDARIQAFASMLDELKSLK